MRIRKAKIDDLNKIKNISQKFDFEIKRDWKDLILSNDKEFFLAIDNDEIIGFTGLIYYDWNNTLQISNIFVHPEYRGKGLAVKLIQYVIEKAKQSSFRCLLAEAPSLNPVKNLYEKLGFRKCGYNDRYYSNNGKEICIWMSLDLK